MKKFSTIREAKKNAPKFPLRGDKVSSKKVGKVSVAVYKGKGGFTAYIDGDKLDTYRSQKEAEAMSTEFAKEV